ncbi:MAG: transporter substrate-binding domain-containing protein [Hyphomicrobiales bacterium]
MKLRSLLVICLALAAFALPASAGAVLDRVLAAKTMVMSTDPDYPPQSSLNAAKEFEGFDIDVGREIARRLGVQIKFVTPAWDMVTAGGWNGRWDISVGSMSPTFERNNVLDFPAVYYYTPAALVVNEQNRVITRPELASGKRIGVGLSTTYESYLRKTLKIDWSDAPQFDFQIDDATVVPFETDQQALDALKEGDGKTLDAVITALPTALASIRRGYPLKVIGAPLFLEPLAVAIDKGDPEWAAKIKEIVQAMHADGTLAKLSLKWYETDLSQ